MDEQKYAVMLTDTQDVMILECDPHREIFENAREAIGCEWIELVESEQLMKDNCIMLIDEEGKLRGQHLMINCIASDLFKSDQHGDPIIGNAVIVKDGEERLGLLTLDEATRLAAGFVSQRSQSIEKISRTFGVLPAEKSEKEVSDVFRRQRCKRNDMER